jgi:hypothetical protein
MFFGAIAHYMSILVDADNRAQTCNDLRVAATRTGASRRLWTSLNLEKYSAYLIVQIGVGC